MMTNHVCKISRKEPELIRPAAETPHELKYLSDIDNQVGLRFQMPLFQFFSASDTGEARNPAEVIKHALAKTLVHYYPMAGRLREQTGRRLAVDCTGEGILFIEASANVGMSYFGEKLYPPFAHSEELLYDVPGSGENLGCPLLLIQVTRLTCGGFILGTRLNHSLCDGGGIVQFLTAVAEIARGALSPTIHPTWQRQLLCARTPPSVTCNHRDFEKLDLHGSQPLSLHKLLHRSFIFNAENIAELRRRALPDAGKCSSFELIAACLWKCRTAALSLDPNADSRVSFAVNTRPLLSPPLPNGYYGNATASPAAVATAGELRQWPLGRVVKLLKEAKGQVTREYLSSLADLIVLNGREISTTPSPGTLLVSNAVSLGLTEVDYGWGKAVYGGPAVAGGGVVGGFASFCVGVGVGVGNGNGKSREIAVGVSLPRDAMERFVVEVEKMVNGSHTSIFHHKDSDNGGGACTSSCNGLSKI